MPKRTSATRNWNYFRHLNGDNSTHLLCLELKKGNPEKYCINLALKDASTQLDFEVVPQLFKSSCDHCYVFQMCQEFYRYLTFKTHLCNPGTTALGQRLDDTTYLPTNVLCQFIETFYSTLEWLTDNLKHSIQIQHYTYFDPDDSVKASPSSLYKQMKWLSRSNVHTSCAHIYVIKNACISLIDAYFPGEIMINFHMLALVGSNRIKS